MPPSSGRLLRKKAAALLRGRTGTIEEAAELPVRSRPMRYAGCGATDRRARSWHLRASRGATRSSRAWLRCLPDEASGLGIRGCCTGSGICRLALRSGAGAQAAWSRRMRSFEVQRRACSGDAAAWCARSSTAWCSSGATSSPLDHWIDGDGSSCWKALPRAAGRGSSTRTSRAACSSALMYRQPGASSIMAALGTAACRHIDPARRRCASCARRSATTCCSTTRGGSATWRKRRAAGQDAAAAGWRTSPGPLTQVDVARHGDRLLPDV